METDVKLSKQQKKSKETKERIFQAAKEILQIAEQHGIEQNYFFLTTFQRYRVQLKILEDLEKTISDEGTLVTKEYVKGRQNVYSHPAISDYNRTTDSANKTVSTLMKIITSLRKTSTTKDDDPLLKIISGEPSEK